MTVSGASHVLERDDRSPAAARRRVAEACADLPRDLVDTAKLLTSELVSNAVQHGVGQVLLTIHRDDDEVSVEVRDEGAATPEPHCCDPDAEHGRGLALLEALATRWTTSGAESGSGTVVWFCLSNPRTTGS